MLAADQQQFELSAGFTLKDQRFDDLSNRATARRSSVFGGSRGFSHPHDSNIQSKGNSVPFNPLNAL